jgi:hypothetical protein
MRLHKILGLARGKTLPTRLGTDGERLLNDEIKQEDKLTKQNNEIKQEVERRDVEKKHECERWDVKWKQECERRNVEMKHEFQRLFDTLKGIRQNVISGSAAKLAEEEPQDAPKTYSELSKRLQELEEQAFYPYASANFSGANIKEPYLPAPIAVAKLRAPHPAKQ